MSADRIRQIFVGMFVAGFFLFLFGPLITMGLTAFNSSSFPRVLPWECFTIEWFGVLADDTRLMQGIRTSFIIGFGVVLLAVPLGLAGALLLTQVPDRARPWYYTVLISPILVPGVVLGISTLIFWDRLGQMLFGSSVFYNGYFLTILGQSTFISAYTMLIFIARLQRFDPALEEAALDLGASHIQTFRKVLLPFLKPAIGSAAVLAFLASFENYNTTVFTAVSEATLTTVLASKVRYGINPSISALAVIIILITLFGACYYELAKRREAKLAKDQKAVADVADVETGRTSRRRFVGEPAAWLILAVFVAGIGTVAFAGSHGVDQCKTEVKAEKKRATDARIKALKAQRESQDSTARDEANPKAPTTTRDTTPRKGTENFNSIFQQDNLEGEAGSADDSSSNTTEEKTPRKGTENFNSMFQQENLEGDTDAGESGSEDSIPEKQRKGTENFNNIFNPGNLKDSSGTQ